MQATFIQIWMLCECYFELFWCELICNRLQGDTSVAPGVAGDSAGGDKDPKGLGTGETDKSQHS